MQNIEFKGFYLKMNSWFGQSSGWENRYKKISVRTTQKLYQVTKNGVEVNVFALKPVEENLRKIQQVKMRRKERWNYN